MIPENLSISVVICAYTSERWDDLVAAVASVRHQTVPAHEVIVVIDYNPALLEQARAAFSAARVIENSQAQGLSGARNSGIAVARGDIVAFLDDDAIAAHDWLEQILAGYAEADVIGVGGSIIPFWHTHRPRWFPAEFDWVVGCTYRGMPEASGPVRNLIGANMSFRREICEQVGGFRNGVGQVGASMLRCDDTEFCIRVGQRWPQQKVVYRAQACVFHRVPETRTAWRYFRTRCYTEGLAKALITRLVGSGDGLSAEWSYTLQTLPQGVLHGFVDTFRGDPTGLARAGAIVAGLAITTGGYLTGSVAARLHATPTRPNGYSC